MNCSLCDSAGCNELFSDAIRSYRHCDACGLIFVPEYEHVSLRAEKERCDLHRNNPGHEGYVRFLNELIEVVFKVTPVSGRVIDYGSGKDAVLTRLLKEKGYDCTAYDPLYGIGKDVLDAAYDTVVLCEVVEHLRGLKKELISIENVTEKSGKIILRTRLYPSLENFPGWWYKNDITHVNFFCIRAIKRFASLLGRPRVSRLGEDIFVLSVA